MKISKKYNLILNDDGEIMRMSELPIDLNKINKINDNFNDDFKKNIMKFNNDFIWEDLTDSNDKKEK